MRRTGQPIGYGPYFGNTHPYYAPRYGFGWYPGLGGSPHVYHVGSTMFIYPRLNGGGVWTYYAPGSVISVPGH